MYEGLPIARSSHGRAMGVARTAIVPSLDQIAEPDGLMRLTCTLPGRGSAVPSGHGGRLPAGEVLELAVVASVHAELVGEGVAEPVRVDVADAVLVAAAIQHSLDTSGRQRTAAAPPERGQVGLEVPAARSADVPGEGLRGAGAHRDEAGAGLAVDEQEVLPAIPIRELDAGQLAETRAGVEQDTDDGLVAEVLELPALACGDQRADVVEVDDGRAALALGWPVGVREGVGGVLLARPPREERASVPPEDRDGLASEAAGTTVSSGATT